MGRDRKGYRITLGIISIVFGVLLISAFDSTDETFFAMGIPGILTLTSGIFHLNAKNNNKAYTTSGILLAVGAGLNFLAIKDISLYAIYAIIVGSFNLVYSQED